MLCSSNSSTLLCNTSTSQNGASPHVRNNIREIATCIHMHSSAFICILMFSYELFNISLSMQTKKKQNISEEHCQTKTASDLWDTDTTTPEPLRSTTGSIAYSKTDRSQTLEPWCQILRLRLAVFVGASRSALDGCRDSLEDRSSVDRSHNTIPETLYRSSEASRWN